MARKLKEVAESLQARLIGDGNISVTGIASVQSAAPGDLVFVQDEKNLESAVQSRAAAVIAGNFAAGKTSSKPILICDDPRLAFARAAHLICPSPARVPGVHPSAIVHAGAKLGSVAIDERAVIAEGVEIADGTWIGAGCVIGRDVFIGEHCELHPNATIYPGTRLANRVIVHAGSVLGSDGFGYARDAKTGRYEKFPQIGRLEIEDDVEIGANSTVDRGALVITRIGRGTKIDNLVHVGHNVQIGTDVVIAAQAGVSGSAVIEDNVIIGGQVGIADHVRIEDGAILGAQTGIPSRKIIRGKGMVFWGTPGRPIRQYLKELALLARLAKKE
jgi:UDP-3-O-[3-hydroxymyristoyl] glucosamine N-acyltransferase